MSRRRTYTRQCTHTGCPERSHVEYTARQDLQHVSPEWTCFRHSQPNEVLSADNLETTAVLTLHPSYLTGRRYVAGVGYTDEPQLTGHYWGPENADKGSDGIVSGPGFRAVAKHFPPGTRLIVTARIQLPDEEQQ